MSQGRILVIRGGAIGDFILTLPVLAALRDHFPHARLGLLAYPRVAPLAVAGGLADETRSIEARPLAAFFARHGELDAGLQEFFGSFAIIISYLYDPDGIFQANIARCSKARFLSGPHRPDDGAGVHAAEVFLKPLERLAIFGADATPRLRLEIRSSPSPLLALHPGSGSERKNWPESRWGELLRCLAGETELPLLLVGGEAEGERLQRLASDLPAGRVEVAQNLPLSELAVRLANCRGFVGHDSGITHLAAAVGLPGMVLWGASVETVWRPRSERMSILRGSPGLASLPVERVLAGIAELRTGFRSAR